MMQRPPKIQLVIAAAVVAMAACVEAGTDPEVATSIQIDTLPFPSVVLGDSLRDTAGVVRGIPVLAYNSRNEPLPQAPVSFIVADTGTGLSIDSEGRVFADSATGPDSLPYGPVRIIAQVGSLQSIARSIFITARPDSLEAASALLDTVTQPDGTTAIFTSDTVAARVLTVLPAGGTEPVAYWVVRFELTDAQMQPVDTAYARLVSGNVRSEIDTTGLAGVASRRVRINISGYPANAGSDTLLVTASARYRGQPVPGSPVQYMLIVRPSQ